MFSRSLKTLRSHSQSISWYSLCPRSQVIVSASSAVTQTLQLAVIRGGYVYKLPKLELEGHEVRERDVVICQLYGKTYVAVFMHDSAARKGKEEVHLHRVASSSDMKAGQSVEKAFVLKLPEECGGSGLALNCVDDIFLVHCQPLLKTYLFDVASSSGDSDGSVTYLRHIACGTFEAATGSSSSSSAYYAASWVTFQPDMVVDAKQGLMWKVRASLTDVDRLAAAIPDPTGMVSFLKRREGAKAILLEALLRFSAEPSVRMRTVGELLDQVNDVYRLHVDEQMQQQMALPASAASTFSSAARQALRQTLSPGGQADAATAAAAASPSSPQGIIQPSSHAQQQEKRRPAAAAAKVVIDQADLYASLFSPMVERLEAGGGGGDVSRRRRLVAVMMEYYRSLESRGIRAQHFLSELLINLLVTSQQWFQLHVLLQYRVIPDSKPLACLLLSLESAYAPALQLATDMLHRMRNSAEEICEVLLSKQLVVPAVRYAAEANLDHVPVRKFLEAALQTGDEAVFLNVFQYFEGRGVVPKSCYQEYLQQAAQNVSTAAKD